MGGKVNLCRNLFEKSETERLLTRPTHRVEDVINMYLEEILQECVDWINLALERDMCSAPLNIAMKLFLISYFRRVLNIVLLGTFPVSDCVLLTFRNPRLGPSSKAGCGI
jgi:hypothetical protein